MTWFVTHADVCNSPCPILIWGSKHHAVAQRARTPLILLAHPATNGLRRRSRCEMAERKRIFFSAGRGALRGRRPLAHCGEAGAGLGEGRPPPAEGGSAD